MRISGVAALMVGLALVYGARHAAAQGTIIEFSARVLRAQDCQRQREPKLAEEVIAPGATVRGVVRYNHPSHSGGNDRVGTIYYFAADQFEVSLWRQDGSLLDTMAAKGAVQLSARLIGTGVGRRGLFFSAGDSGSLTRWPGQLDNLSFGLNLDLGDEGESFNALPGRSRINALPISPLSRIYLYAEKKPAAGESNPLLWQVCGDLISLNASGD